MIVVDASAVVDVLTHKAAGDQLIDLLRTQELSAPHLLDAEVMNTLRSLELGKRLDPASVDAARHGYGDLFVERCRIDALAERIWELRCNFNAYDASYISLAEALDVPLVTCDSKLAPGSPATHNATVSVFRS